MNESAVQQQTRLAMARMGNQVWRNNSGACIDETGRLIRYGLGNDSAQLNKMIKSSDLIGITPVQAYCTLNGVAAWRTLGVFCALECKPSGWHMTPGDQRAAAQARFHDIVRDAGGFAGFVTHPDDIAGIIG
jgi:hypothetical protein